MLALGQSPWSAPPEAPAPKVMTPAEMNEQVKSALLMAAARRKVDAEHAAASAPRPMDVNGLNEQIKGALLMAGARRKVEGQRDAEALGSESPLLQDNGGLDMLRNPAFGKTASALVSAARAHAALTRQPEPEGAPEAPAPQGPAPQVPSPPMAPQGPAPAPTAPPETPVSPVDPLLVAQKALGKITKKAGEQAKSERPDTAFEHAYEPLTEQQLYGKGLQDSTFAARELAKEKAAGKDIGNDQGYMDSIVHDRTKRRNILAEIAGDHEGDSDVIAQLLEDLHHTRRAARAHAAIQHFTKLMSPEAAAAVRKRLDRSYINSTWLK